MASTLLKLIRAERARRSSAPLVEVIWSDLEGPDFCKTDQEFDQRVEALRRAGRIGPRTMVVRFARNGEGRPDPAADCARDVGRPRAPDKLTAARHQAALV
jgi:hypothetical protein